MEVDVGAGRKCREVLSFRVNQLVGIDVRRLIRDLADAKDHP